MAEQMDKTCDSYLERKRGEVYVRRVTAWQDVAKSLLQSQAAATPKNWGISDMKNLAESVVQRWFRSDYLPRLCQAPTFDTILI